MKKKVFVSAVVATMFSCFSYASERDALELLYDALSGDQWDSSGGWLSDAPLDEWHGVVIRDGRVVGIELPGNNLTGQLPSGLEGLNQLEVLDLRWNNIWGDIPESLGEMSRLESLLLSGNELSGEIPWSIGSIRTLKRLDLSNNQLWGGIPDALGDLQSLESLGLQHNQLTGPVPRELTQIGSLRRVILNNNDLSGAVPSRFEQTTSGLHVRLDNNPIAANRFSNLDTPIFEERDLLATGQISGRDLLDETTVVLGDNQSAEFVRSTLSAVIVKDGFLSLESAELPQGVNIEQFERVVDAVNDGLRETGDRIRSINDLERVLELHDGPRLNIPDVENDGYTFQSSNPLGSAGNGLGYDFGSGAGSGFGPAQSNSESTTAGGSGAAMQTEPVAGINCPGTQAHNSHISTTQRSRGSIIGKATVSCVYEFGPAQTITYDAYSYLQRWSYWMWYGYWRRVGQLGNATVTGNSVYIPQNDLVAVTSCSSGTYRTRLALYIDGSVNGMFVPYPGLYESAARYLECVD